jgi:hypothetical protein
LGKFGGSVSKLFEYLYLEKRELLTNLQSKLVMKNKKIILGK